MFIEYLPSNTCLHTLDIRTKMLGFTCIVTLSFFFSDPLYNLFVLALVCILAFLAKFPFKKIYKLLLPLSPIFLLIMVFSALTPSNQFVTPVDGLLHGLALLIRLVTMVIASSLLTLTSPIDDFIQLLSKLKVPYEYSFAITTALRFIPTMNNKRMLILEAQKARGAKFDGSGLRNFTNRYVPIMVPMMVNSIKMSNNLSMAMLNRGFGYSANRTLVKEISFKSRDYIASALIILVTGVGICIG